MSEFKSGEVSQTGFLGSLTCRMFIKESPWAQHVWEGGGSKSGQREKPRCSAGPGTALGHLTRALDS